MLQQAMCPNDDCPVFFWVPWDTAAANLADMGDVIIDVIPYREKK